MQTEIRVGLDNHADGYECGREAARAALSNWTPDSVALTLLFTSHPQPSEVLRGVNETLSYPPLVGATSMGEYTQQGYVEQGAGLMLIRSGQLQVNLVGRKRGWFNQSGLLGKLRGISKGGLGHFNHRALMLFPDDESMNLDSLIQKAVSETAMLYDIVGGPRPMNQNPPPYPGIFHNRHMLQIGLTGAELLSQEPLGLALANGWQPISGPYRVTQADERRVVKIDGRPAREIYEDFFQEQGIAITEAQLTGLLLKAPIGVCQGGECKVSMVMGLDAGGALLMAAPPPTGSLVHILTTQSDALIAAAERSIQTALGALSSQMAAGALFIDCMSTAMVLDTAYERQRSAVQNRLGETPFLGFRSHGVIARLQGQVNGLYECSVAACVLPA